jgi:hypothetical protein
MIQTITVAKTVDNIGIFQTFLVAIIVLVFVIGVGAVFGLVVGKVIQATKEKTTFF